MFIITTHQVSPLKDNKRKLKQICFPENEQKSETKKKRKAKKKKKKRKRKTHILTNPKKKRSALKDENAEQKLTAGEK